jgi:CDP-2,3-bis-(O-geranylgeranyl)-sn-glycerol synthase
MFNLVLAPLYFFLPAYFTNLTASLSRKIKFLTTLNIPVDFDKSLNGYPIFGTHKTWRGLICGTIIGMLVAILQRWFYQFECIKEISFLNYQEINIFLFGFLISFGAIFGDLLFAFFKRRQNIQPGEPWIPFDQINYVIGAFLILTPFFKLPISVWFTILILTFFLHILGNHLGYWLGWQENRW